MANFINFYFMLYIFVRTKYCLISSTKYHIFHTTTVASSSEKMFFGFLPYRNESINSQFLYFTFTFLFNGSK